MVGSPPRDNGKVLFSITVVVGVDIGASAGGSGSQRAATCALGCGALVATGSAGLGASDADCTGAVGKILVFTDGNSIESMGFPPGRHGRIG